MNIKLTVFFDDPFWAGIFERSEGTFYETSKFVFGTEPKDYEVYDFVLKNYYSLSFSRPVSFEIKPEKQKINPKRLQRVIKKEISRTGTGTKSQMALKLEHESRKQERKVVSREMREEAKRQDFLKKQEKKKEKKKGH